MKMKKKLEKHKEDLIEYSGGQIIHAILYNKKLDKKKVKENESRQ